MTFTIEQARKYAGLTQAAMAEKLGINRQTYAKIESNPEKATIEQAKIISAITGVGLDQIFFAGELY